MVSSGVGGFLIKMEMSNVLSCQSHCGSIVRADSHLNNKLGTMAQVLCNTLIETIFSPIWLLIVRGLRTESCMRRYLVATG